MFVGHTPIKPSIHGVPREGDVEEGIVLAAQAHVKATDELCPAVTVEHREAAGVLAGEHLKFFSVYALFSPLYAWCVSGAVVLWSASHIAYGRSKPDEDMRVSLTFAIHALTFSTVLAEL